MGYRGIRLIGTSSGEPCPVGGEPCPPGGVPCPPNPQKPQKLENFSENALPALPGGQGGQGRAGLEKNALPTQKGDSAPETGKNEGGQGCQGILQPTRMRESITRIGKMPCLPSPPGAEVSDKLSPEAWRDD